ncbi:MAG: T9SS type A sorting domain-containing protein, partial [Sphingobacteriales bacterium]
HGLYRSLINNMVMAAGRMFLSGRKIINGTTGTVLAGFDMQTGNALTFPVANWVNNPKECFKLIAYGNYVYADMDYTSAKIFRFNPATLQFDNSWALEYPFNFNTLNNRICNIYNDILYLKMADNNYHYIKPYQLSTLTELPVTSMLIPILNINYSDVEGVSFMGSKAIISGRFDRLQSPVPGQNLRYGIGFIEMGSNNLYAPSSHVLDEFSGNVNAAPAYSSVEQFGDRIYANRRPFDDPSMPYSSRPRIYDTTGMRWYPQWNPKFTTFASILVPISKDTVVAITRRAGDQIMEDRPYYGMLRFQLGATTPDATLQVAVQPGTQVQTGTALTFSTTATNAGSSPVYQWFKNNVPVAGATGLTWSATAGNEVEDNDEIKARIIAIHPCRNADTAWSNSIIMHVDPLSVSGLHQPKGFKAYPNPSSGLVYCTGIERGDQLRIYDYLGRTVQVPVLRADNTLQVDLSHHNQGVYLFKF